MNPARTRATRQARNTWLMRFAAVAAKTDRFVGNSDHTALLAAGLIGETGSVLAELKKEQRERDAYPAYRHRMIEEIGDVLWYYIRLVSVTDAELLKELYAIRVAPNREINLPSLTLFLLFGAAVGDLVTVLNKGTYPLRSQDLRTCLQRVWHLLVAAARKAHVSIETAAESNIEKTTNRWPSKKVYSGLFDLQFPEEERLPRRLAAR